MRRRPAGGRRSQRKTLTGCEGCRRGDGREPEVGKRRNVVVSEGKKKNKNKCKVEILHWIFLIRYLELAVSRIANATWWQEVISKY